MSNINKKYQETSKKFMGALKAVDELIEIEGEDNVCDKLTDDIGADLWPSRALDTIITARTNAAPPSVFKTDPLMALLFRANDDTMGLLINIIQSAELLIEEVERDQNTSTEIDYRADRLRGELRPLIDIVNNEMYERVQFYKDEIEQLKTGA